MSDDEKRSRDPDRVDARKRRFVFFQLPIVPVVVGAADYAVGSWGPAITSAVRAVLGCIVGRLAASAPPMILLVT